MARLDTSMLVEKYMAAKKNPELAEVIELVPAENIPLFFIGVGFAAVGWGSNYKLGRGLGVKFFQVPVELLRLQ